MYSVSVLVLKNTDAGNLNSVFLSTDTEVPKYRLSFGISSSVN